MNNLFNTIFKYFNKINKDKYQHFTFGAIIASIIFSLFFFLSPIISLFISVLSVIIVELVKEFVIDDYIDFIDICATLLGGLIIWVPIIILIFC